MLSEQYERELAQLLKAARSVPRPGWQERAMEAMVNVRPTRVGSRRRLVALIGAGVLVMGLGFVPFPAGTAKGAWDRALAAAERARTVHLTGHQVTEWGEFDFEQWLSADFHRYDMKDGERVGVWLDDPGRRQVRPDRDPKRSPIRETGTQSKRVARRYIQSAFLGAPFLGGFDRANVIPSSAHRYSWWLPSREGLFQRLSTLKSSFALKITERRERTLWRGARDVVQAEGTAKSAYAIGNLHYPLVTMYLEGDKIRIRAEVQRSTGLLAALRVYRLENGSWLDVYRTKSIEWDAGIPESIQNVRPTQGHVELVDTWWRERLAKTLAARSSQDWEVTLHALDLNRSGDVFVTFSRKPKPGTRFASRDCSNRMLGMTARAVDDREMQYSASTRGNRCDTPRSIKGYPYPVLYGLPETHARVRLYHRNVTAPVSSLTKVTVTISNGDVQSKGVQSVVFRDLLAPTRHSADDLFEEAYEKRYF